MQSFCFCNYFAPWCIEKEKDNRKLLNVFYYIANNSEQLVVNQGKKRLWRSALGIFFHIWLQCTWWPFYLCTDIWVYCSLSSVCRWQWGRVGGSWSNHHHMPFLLSHILLWLRRCLLVWRYWCLYTCYCQLRWSLSPLLRGHTCFQTFSTWCAVLQIFCEAHS